MNENMFSNNTKPDMEKTILESFSADNCQSFRKGDVILDRYTVIYELGHGGMGVVYKCYDNVSKTECAIKTLVADLSHCSKAMEDIHRNYRLVCNLFHENIAAYKALERDSSSGMYYLVMEYVDGEALDRYIDGLRDKNCFSEKTVIKLVKKIAAALDFAHKNRILHRDIKPSNIMITRDGNVKIVDFGLASAFHTTLSNVDIAANRDSKVEGTPLYMAPEQYRGGSCSAASDQYSLAATVYEIFARRPVFYANDAGVLRECVLKETPERLRNVSAAVAYALRRALRKAPEKRYKSCSEFADALEKNALVEAIKSGWDDLKTVLDKSKVVLYENIYRIFRVQIVRLLVILLLISLLLMAAGKIVFDLDFWWWDLFWLPVIMLICKKVTAATIKLSTDKTVWLFWLGCVVWLALPVSAFFYCRSLTFNALHGDVLAMTQLAEFTEEPLDSLYWYQKAAEKGDRYSMYKVAKILQNSDVVLAFEYFQKAANLDLARAQYELGNCYRDGIGAEADLQKALQWWKKSAAQGSQDAFETVVDQYIKDDKLDAIIDWVRFFPQWEKSAEQWTIYQGKVFYRGGIAAEKRGDDERSAQWFAEAVKYRDPAAVYKLALLYRQGKGVEHNHQKALELFELACELKYPKAPFYCGDYYENGTLYGLEKNEEKAKKHYLDGRELRDPQAMLRLADAIREGRLGLEKNYNDAFDLYKKIEKSGLTDALFKLGVCYWNGIGCKKDIPQAGEYFKKAVECEDGINMGEYWFYLGLYYKEIKAEKSEIQKAFTRAKDLGCKKAEEYL